jgi:hypothetical protein
MTQRARRAYRRMALMIGTEVVSLVPASSTSYDDIRQTIEDSPDRDLWYGPNPSTKSMRAINGGPPGAAVPLVVLFSIAALLLDAFGDVASAWNAWNIPFFILTIAGLVLALVLSSLVAARTPAAGWKRHKLIVKLGDRADIGIGDIWQDAPNGVCLLDCSLLSDFRGRGLGSVATRMMIRKCFTELGARRVEASALSSNPRSLKMNDRMVPEGVLKERYVIRGQPVDEHLFRLLKSEWQAQLAASGRQA